MVDVEGWPEVTLVGRLTAGRVVVCETAQNRAEAVVTTARTGAQRFGAPEYDSRDKSIRI